MHLVVVGWKNIVRLDVGTYVGKEDFCWRLHIVKKINTQIEATLLDACYTENWLRTNSKMCEPTRCEMSGSVLYLIFGSRHRQDYSINLIVCHKSL